MPLEAGEGEHHVYRIVPPGESDPEPMKPGAHYLGLDAVAWFVNKKSRWLKKKMASGVLDIKLASGEEKYPAALGTFSLDGGARIAPVFDRPVLPDRNYRGGHVTLAASLTGIKKNTAIGDLLSSAANASLGIVSGMIQTATLTGPAVMLAAAGADLVAGVRKLLSETGEKREPLFDFSSLEYTVRPGEPMYKESFLLFHRGGRLHEEELEVRSVGGLSVPHHRSAPLDDGAWLLIRMRKSSSYSGYREWFSAARALRSALRSLVQDVKGGVKSIDEALKRLEPSKSGNETLWDDLNKLRAIIAQDGVLTEKEAGLHAAALFTSIMTAKKSIQEGRPEALDREDDALKRGLEAGSAPAGPVGDAFAEGMNAFVEERRALAPAEEPWLPEGMSADEAFREMKELGEEGVSRAFELDTEP